jgi:hypothetical protein
LDAPYFLEKLLFHLKDLWDAANPDWSKNYSSKVGRLFILNGFALIGGVHALLPVAFYMPNGVAYNLPAYAKFLERLNAGEPELLYEAFANLWLETQPLMGHELLSVSFYGRVGNDRKCYLHYAPGPCIIKNGMVIAIDLGGGGFIKDIHFPNIKKVEKHYQYRCDEPLFEMRRADPVEEKKVIEEKPVEKKKKAQVRIVIDEEDEIDIIREPRKGDYSDSSDEEPVIKKKLKKD